MNDDEVPPRGPYDPDKRPDLIPRFGDGATSSTTRHRPPEPRRPHDPVPIDIPGHTTLQALPNPPRLEEKYAGPPPPGYRYTMDGRIVPLLERPEVVLETEEGQRIFALVLEKTGSMRAACDCLGIRDTQKAKRRLEIDADFALAVEQAAERHRDTLYQAAVSRATVGYEIPIVGGRNKDEIVAYERRFSDPLLALLLKRHFPEFREATNPKVAIDSRSITINQANEQPKPPVDLRKLPRDKRDALRKLLAEDPPTEVDPSGVKDV